MPELAREYLYLGDFSLWSRLQTGELGNYAGLRSDATDAFAKQTVRRGCLTDQFGREGAGRLEVRAAGGCISICAGLTTLGLLSQLT